MASKMDRKQMDLLGNYFMARGEYLDRLDEAGFLTSTGSLKTSFVGSVLQPAPGDEHKWEELCREYPRSPLCLLGSMRETDLSVEKFVDIRRDYEAVIAERGLEHVQRGVTDLVLAGGAATIGGAGAAGLVNPDDPNADDLIDHPTIGPRVREMALRLQF